MQAEEVLPSRSMLPGNFSFGCFSRVWAALRMRWFAWCSRNQSTASRGTSAFSQTARRSRTQEETAKR